MIDAEFQRGYICTEQVTIVNRFPNNADSFYTRAEACEESFRDERKSSSEYFRDQTSDEKVDQP
jgi:hypothetical protein